MPSQPKGQPASAPPSAWEVDPSVLACRYGTELAVYHLRTGRSYTLQELPARVWELLERGYEPQAIAAALVRENPQAGEHLEPELDGLLEMLERKQLITRVAGASDVAPRQREDEGVFLILASEGARSRGAGRRAVPKAALYTDTVLQRVPEFVVEVTSGHARVSLSKPRESVVEGGPYVLGLLDACEHPRAVSEVVRVLQGRAQEIQDWIDLVDTIVHLFEGGALTEVKRDPRMELDSQSAAYALFPP